MVEELMNDYLSNVDAASNVDYSDKKSVRKFNASSDRMRAIVDEVVSLGEDAIRAFASVLDREPASNWAAVHLVEKANLDASTLSRCFAIVEQAKSEAQANGRPADAMIKEMWLKEWRAKKATSK